MAEHFTKFIASLSRVALLYCKITVAFRGTFAQLYCITLCWTIRFPTARVISFSDPSEPYNTRFQPAILQTALRKMFS